MINRAFFAVAVFFVFFSGKPVSHSSQKPNIIFILTDDHRWDAMGAAGNKIIRTPNLDKLAGKGILFSNAYVTTSICCVSRASILTGQYESRHKVNNFSTDLSAAQFANAYPAVLKGAGYKIGFVGKYGVGDHPPAESFDYWSCTERGQPPYILKNAAGKSVHHTDSVGHDVELFLNKFAGKEPFCLSVGFKAPHELDGKPATYVVQERFKNLYKDVKVPVPETADAKYWNSFPDFFRTEQNEARKRWHHLFDTPEKYQQNVKDYYRLISGVDEVVGKMVLQLKRLGIDKNTVIIFMGDNGFYQAEHGLEGKWYGHEESIRVPLIYYDPRMPAGRTGKKNGQMVLNIDIAPTIISLASGHVPEAVQGKSLLDATGDRMAQRSEFFYEHTFNKSPRIPNVEGVVTNDFKYMKFIEHGYEELYSIKNDPKERKNLATDVKYSRELEKMRVAYARLKQAVK